MIKRGFGGVKPKRRRAYRYVVAAFAVLLVLASGLAVAVASTGLPSVPFSFREDRASVSTAGPATALPQDPALAADAAKARASGSIGPFTVTADRWPDWPTCESMPPQAGSNPSQSPLYFGMPIDSERIRQCPNGAIQSLVSSDNHGQVVRRYFVGEARVNFPYAASDRVKSTTVSGLPAIVAEPIPSLPGYQASVGPAGLVVLERAPSVSRPGILLTIDGDDVDQMTALAQQAISNGAR